MDNTNRHRRNHSQPNTSANTPVQSTQSTPIRRNRYRFYQNSETTQPHFSISDLSPPLFPQIQLDNLRPVSPKSTLSTQTRSPPPYSPPPRNLELDSETESNEKTYRSLIEGPQTNNNLRDYSPDNRIIVINSRTNIEHNYSETVSTLSAENEPEINNQLNLNPPPDIDFEQEALDNYLNQLNLDTNRDHNSESEPEIMAAIVKPSKFTGSSNEDPQE